MEPEGSLPHSQVRATCPELKRDRSPKVQSRSEAFYESFVTGYGFTVRRSWNLAQPPCWRTTPCRLSATAYSIYSQRPSILEAVLPWATCGRAMPWWHGPTYHGLLRYTFVIWNTFEHGGRTSINSAVQAHTYTHVMCVRWIGCQQPSLGCAEWWLCYWFRLSWIFQTIPVLYLTF